MDPQSLEVAKYVLSESPSAGSSCQPGRSWYSGGLQLLLDFLILWTSLIFEIFWIVLAPNVWSVDCYSKKRFDSIEEYFDLALDPGITVCQVQNIALADDLPNDQTIKSDHFLD